MPTLHSTSYTRDTATVQRWSLALTPEQEQSIISFYEGLPREQETSWRVGRGMTIRGRRISTYDFLLDNCTTVIRDALQSTNSWIGDTLAGPWFDNPRRGTLANQLRLLDAVSPSVTRLSDVPARNSNAVK